MQRVVATFSVTYPDTTTYSNFPCRGTAQCQRPCGLCGVNTDGRHRYPSTPIPILPDPRARWRKTHHAHLLGPAHIRSPRR